MAFNSFFNDLPFQGTFDENAMPMFPYGGDRGMYQQQASAAPQQFGQSAPMQGGGAGGGGPSYGPPNDGTGAGWDGQYGSTGNRVGDAQFAAMGMPSGVPSGFGTSYGQRYQPAPLGGFENNASQIFNQSGAPTFDQMNAGVTNPTGGQSRSGGGIFDQAGAPTFDQMNTWMQKPSYTPQTQFDFSSPHSTLFGEPHFDGSNYAQAGLNMASHFIPGLDLIAGLGQGFNQFGQAPITGNSITDMAGTAGPIQGLAANFGNWLNRLGGGDYMDSNRPPATLSGPSQPGGPDWNKAVQVARDNAAAPSSGISGLLSGLMPTISAGGAPSDGGFAPQYGTDFGSMPNMLDTFMSGAGFAGRWGGGGDSGDGGWGSGANKQKIGTGDWQ